MPVRRPSLNSADKKPVVPDQTEAKIAVTTEEAAPKKWPRATTRQGKRGIVVWVDQLSFVQVGVIAREEDRTIQSLMIEALNMLYAARGKPRYD